MAYIETLRQHAWLCGLGLTDVKTSELDIPGIYWPHRVGVPYTDESIAEMDRLNIQIATYGEKYGALRMYNPGNTTKLS